MKCTGPSFLLDEQHLLCYIFHMALINRDSALQHTLRLLKKTEPPGGIQLFSYKRNRQISIMKEDTSSFLVHEQGYDNKKWCLPYQELSKLLKTLIKREFPRSRKIRFMTFQHPDELNNTYKKI